MIRKDDAEASQKEQCARHAYGEHGHRHLFRGGIAGEALGILEVLKARKGEIEPENDAAYDINGVIHVDIYGLNYNFWDVV